MCRGEGWLVLKGVILVMVVAVRPCSMQKYEWVKKIKKTKKNYIPAGSRRICVSSPPYLDDGDDAW